LDILHLKKEAKLSASEVPRQVVGSGVEDLRHRNCLLFAKDVWGCQRLKIQGWDSNLFLEDRMSL